MSSQRDNRPITPPSTPSWNESQKTSSTTYPSPTTSSSKSTSPSASQTRPNLRASFSTKSTSIRENVQVMVRCRPRSEKELQYDEEPCWLISPEEGSIELARLKSPSTISTFHYDNVVMGVDNEQVYKAGILDLVRSAMMGYNGTVFAYGQTASGKTYTMMGTETEPGVIPRAVREVFSYIEEDTHGREYLLRVSYMEIYNEKIKDLLNPENTMPEIIEDKKGVSVRNLKEVIVKTVQEVMACIKEGEGNRHISATDYNEHSSRSHTIFQLVIESRSKGLPTNANRGVRVSQLNLIDLAGSEKVATDNERRKEGAYINKSLLTLGNVISKLTSDEPSAHIPFRNSKLTRILQAALSGNARISVICTINPTFASKDESLNTLRFAQRAKLVKTAAKMTRILDNSELQNCLIKIAELQTKMQEKTDLEAETRERLKNLLGLILTSSKKDADHPDHVEMFSQFSNISADDLMKESTMRDVVARCEEGFAAQISIHQKQMDKMSLHVESMQDMMNIMESVHVKQNDTLTKRDAQIEKLKQELVAIKSTMAQNTAMKPTTANTAKMTKTPVRATKTPRPTFAPVLSPIPTPATLPTKTLDLVSENISPTPSSSIAPSLATPTPSTTTSTQYPLPTLDAITPSITIAIQHITEAISTGFKPQEDDYDMVDSYADNATVVNISDAVTTIFHSVLASTLLNKEEKVDIPKNEITAALQSAIQNNINASKVAIPPNFTTINEAVLFIKFAQDFSPVVTNSVGIVEELAEATNMTLPDLIIENPTADIQNQKDTVIEEFSEEPSVEIEAQVDSEEEAIEDQDIQESETEAESIIDEPESEHIQLLKEIADQNQPILSTTPEITYEPYTLSVLQPIPFTFLFTRYTLALIVVYMLLQSN